MEVTKPAETETGSLFSFMQETTQPASSNISSFSFMQDAEVQNQDSQTGFGFLKAASSQNSETTGFQFMSATAAQQPFPYNDNGTSPHVIESSEDVSSNGSSFSFLQQSSPTVSNNMFLLMSSRFLLSSKTCLFSYHDAAGGQCSPKFLREIWYA